MRKNHFAFYTSNIVLVRINNAKYFHIILYGWLYKGNPPKIHKKSSPPQIPDPTPLYTQIIVKQHKIGQNRIKYDGVQCNIIAWILYNHTTVQQGLFKTHNTIKLGLHKIHASRYYGLQIWKPQYSVMLFCCKPCWLGSHIYHAKL